MLGVPLYGFALLFAAEWRRTAGGALPWSLRVAALGSAGAGVVHGIATPHHVHESALLGWFFTLLCVGQLVWVVTLLIAPRRSVVVLGIISNLGVVVLWAWTRAVGIPFGIAGGARQRFTALDLTATALEVAVVLSGLAWAASRGGATMSGHCSPVGISRAAFRAPRFDSGH
ncbi:MAG: hypothetical protein M3P04_02055 [Actinomycetota bacterium]|nr:hypothetical protein [Actinomycetota bacterium]